MPPPPPPPPTLMMYHQPPPAPPSRYSVNYGPPPPMQGYYDMYGTLHHPMYMPQVSQYINFVWVKDRVNMRFYNRVRWHLRMHP